MNTNNDNLFDADLLIKEIRLNKIVNCPRCGEQLKYQANSDMSRIFSIYCEKCRFNVKMTYSLN